MKSTGKIKVYNCLFSPWNQIEIHSIFVAGAGCTKASRKYDNLQYNMVGRLVNGTKTKKILSNKTIFFSAYNLFINKKKPRIHKFKLLQNVFKTKKQVLKCFLK